MQPIAEVVTDQEREAEQACVERARQAVSASAWVVGECATEWCEKYARGRTDADFGKLVGLTKDQVRQRRNVWEKFGKAYTCTPLKFGHARAALSWDDAGECLDWAIETDATVAEMIAFHNMRNGITPKTQKNSSADQHDSAQTFPKADEPHEPFLQPSKSEQVRGKSEQVRGKSEESPSKSTPKGNPKNTQSSPKNHQTSSKQTAAAADPLVLIRQTCEVETARDTTLRQIWRLLKELDPAGYKRAKPTRTALLEAIPGDFDPLLKEAATQWAEFKLDLESKARIQNMGQWATVLKQMTRFDPADVLDSVEDAIANGWQGWKHGLKDKGVSPRERSATPGRKVYRDFD